MHYYHYYHYFHYYFMHLFYWFYEISIAKVFQLKEIHNFRKECTKNEMGDGDLQALAGQKGEKK